MTAFPFLATAAASIPFPPFGVVGLDPSSILVLPSIPIPQPAGSASTSFRVPGSPSLLGITVYGQAMSVSSLDSPHLTNVTVDELTR